MSLKMQWRLQSFLHVALVVLCQPGIPRVALAADPACQELLYNLPSSYTTSIQINLNEGFDIGGHSILLDEMVVRDKDGKSKLRSDVFYVMQPQMLTKESLIWNPDIDGVGNYINVIETNMQDTTCKTDKVWDGSIFSEIFKFTGGESSFPSITDGLHFGSVSGYKCVNSSVIMKGIPAVHFSGQLVMATREYTVNYYWSSPSYAQEAGFSRSVPLLAELTMPDSGLLYVIDFINFVEAEMPPETFMAPMDVACEGRVFADVILFTPPPFLWCSAEVIFPMEYDTQGVIPIQEWYNEVMMVRRLDVNALTAGKISYVWDLTSGILYERVIKFRTCTKRWMGPKLPTPWKIRLHDDDGAKVDYFNPAFEKGILKGLAFNGKAVERGMEMRFFQAGTNTEFLESDVVLGMTDGQTVLNVGSGLPVDKSYPAVVKIYESLNASLKIVINVGAYEGVRDSFDTYDVTYCFPDNEVKHVRIRFPVQNSTVVHELLHTPELIRDEIRMAVSICAKVTSFRVQNVQVEENDKDGFLYAIISLIDFPVVQDINESNIILPAKLPLTEAMDNLQAAVRGGTLQIMMPFEAGITLKADPDVFQEVDRLTTWAKDGEGPKKYSPGAMAGLAIAMLIITIPGVIAIFVFVLKW